MASSSAAAVDETTPLLQDDATDRDLERDGSVAVTNQPDEDNLNTTNNLNSQNDVTSTTNLRLAAILHLAALIDGPIVAVLALVVNEHFRHLPENFRNYWVYAVRHDLFGVFVMSLVAVIWSSANLASLRWRRPSSLLGPAVIGAAGHAFVAWPAISIALEGLASIIMRDVQEDCYRYDPKPGMPVHGPPECYTWIAKFVPLASTYLAFLLVMGVVHSFLFFAYLNWTWNAFIAWFRGPTRVSGAGSGGAGRWTNNLSFPTGQVTASFTIQFLGSRSLPAVTGSLSREGGQPLPQPSA